MAENQWVTGVFSTPFKWSYNPISGFWAHLVGKPKTWSVTIARGYMGSFKNRCATCIYPKPKMQSWQIKV